MLCRKDMYVGCRFYLQCRACMPLVVNFFCACLITLCTYAQQGYVFQSGFLHQASCKYRAIHAFPNKTLRSPALKQFSLSFNGISHPLAWSWLLTAHAVQNANNCSAVDESITKRVCNGSLTGFCFCELCYLTTSITWPHYV